VSAWRVEGVRREQEGAVVKRALLLVVGLGAGVVIGAYVVRRLEEAQRAVAPATIAGNAGRAAGSFTERLRAAAEEGRAAAAAREAELRSQYEVPSLGTSLGQQP
jgi:hypothetical protein